jgi:hypothetical protein
MASVIMSRTRQEFYFLFVSIATTSCTITARPGKETRNENATWWWTVESSLTLVAGMFRRAGLALGGGSFGNHFGLWLKRVRGEECDEKS